MNVFTLIVQKIEQEKERKALAKARKTLAATLKEVKEFRRKYSAWLFEYNKI